MAENLQNLYSTTLAAPYTSGAGSITVAAAPTAGNGTYTMSLVIRDAGTGAVILIFRVTSVSGTTLTGAAEGTDTSAGSGSTVDGSMITVASLATILGGNYGPQNPLTEPKLQSFALVNAGSVAVDTANNGIGLKNPTNESNINAHMYVFPVPATPYHVEFCLSIRNFSNTNCLAGVCFTNGNSGTPKAMIYGLYQIGNSGGDPMRFVQFYLSDPTTYGGSTPIDNISFVMYGGFIYLRLGDDGSGGGAARTYDATNDPNDYFNMGGESRTSQFTATHIGLVLNSGPNAVRCHSINITG